MKTGKLKLYIVLLVLGVALTGGSVWLLFHPAPAIDAPEDTPAISERTSYSHLIPDSMPVISANISHVMRGEFNLLSICGDGKIIYIEEKGLRMPSPEHPPSRTWKTGELQEEELDSLLKFMKNSGFEELEDGYKFPGKPIEGGGFSMGDMSYAVSINHADLHKTVTAFGYLTPDQGLTYPDMPYPLNEIYKRLKEIADNRTEEIARETINFSLLWK